MWFPHGDAFPGPAGFPARTSQRTLFRLTNSVHALDSPASATEWQTLALTTDLHVHVRHSHASGGSSAAVRLPCTPSCPSPLNSMTVVGSGEGVGTTLAAAASLSCPIAYSGPTIAFLTEEEDSPGRLLHILHPSTRAASPRVRRPTLRRGAPVAAPWNAYSSHPVSRAIRYVAVDPHGARIFLIPDVLNAWEGELGTIDIVTAVEAAGDRAGSTPEVTSVRWGVHQHLVRAAGGWHAHRNRRTGSSSSSSPSEHARIVVREAYARHPVDGTTGVLAELVVVTDAGDLLVLYVRSDPREAAMASAPASLMPRSLSRPIAAAASAMVGVDGASRGLGGSGAPDCAAAWSLANRWQLSRRFTEALAEANAQRGLAQLTAASHASARAQGRAWRRSARDSLRLLARTANGRVALLRIGTGAVLCAMVAGAECEHGARNAAALSRRGARRRGVDAVYIRFPSAGVELMDAVCLEGGGVSGFVGLTRRAGRGAQHALLAGPSALTRGGVRGEAVVELVFIPYSGLAVPLYAVRSPSAAASAKDSLHPGDVEVLMQDTSTLRLAWVAWETLHSHPDAPCSFPLGLRVVVDSGSASGAAAAVIVALPDLRTILRGATEVARHDRLSALVRLSLLADLAAGLPLPAGPHPLQHLGATVGAVDALRVRLYECAEAVVQPACSMPTPRREGWAPGWAPATPPAAASVVQAALTSLMDGDHPVKGIVAVFESVAAVLLEGGLGDGPAHLPLLLFTREALAEAVSFLVSAGAVTALLAALSFFVAHARARPVHAAGATQACMAPLFDAAYACLAVSFPDLAEDVLPLCSAEAQHAVRAARAVLLSPAPAMRSAASLITRGLASAQEGADGLAHAAHAEVADRAYRLFLEAGPGAAVKFLDSFLTAPTTSESIAELHRSYAQLHARTVGLAV